MGGHAFMWHYTPRMPSEVYETAVENLTVKLRTKFSAVIIPPHLPGKLDHGDVDVYVGGPKDGELPSVQDLASLIAAFEVNDIDDKQWTYFAIRWPVCHLPELPPRPAEFEQTRWTRNPETDNENAIQVDLNQHKDPMLTEWAAFYTSFGSLRPILSAIFCGYGLHQQLRPSNKYDGLVLRIESLERAVEERYLTVKEGKKWCDVHITTDPSQVLRFAGMLGEGERWYDLAFKTQDDLAAFICTCRFFDPARLQFYQDRYHDESQRYRDADKYYQFFKYWAIEYVPPRLETIKPGSCACLSRTEVELEVVHFFSDRRVEIENKIRAGKALYEPRKFWMTIESQLRLLIAPEVTSELNFKRYGRLATGLWSAWGWLKSVVYREAAGMPGACISAEDQSKLKGMVSTRVGRIIRLVKARTVNFVVERYSHDQDAAEVPREYELWAAGAYDQLRGECIQNREMLENAQKDIDVERYLSSLERKGKLKTPRGQ